MSTVSTIQPSLGKARIASLDVLRGFALLGILLMNIQAFSMIGAAYLNPTAYGDLTGWNKIVWMGCHVFADAKFMSLFSMLFGAGIVLMAGKAKGAGHSGIGLHFRRNFWLFLIGAIHAFLIWGGDILMAYATCSCFVFWFRNLSAKALIPIGVLVFSVPSLLFLMFGFSLNYMPESELTELMMDWSPDAYTIENEVLLRQSGYWEMTKAFASDTWYFQTFIFLIYVGWRAAGLMLIGMGLFKVGALTARLSRKAYLLIIGICGAVGLGLILYGMDQQFGHDWTLDYSMFLGSQFNYWGSAFMAVVYLGIIMLWMQSSLWQGFKNTLASIGRMAFTNYLSQSLICTFIFYGWGLGYFGEIERVGQLCIVLSVWLFQILFSQWWLSRFRFGPAEWLWRSLTYWKLQPMKKDKA